MPEKELRIALVCFGGVSLAVYMHGVTKEILKLVRASRALHAITCRNARSNATFFDVRNGPDPEYDTESIYFDLLREIGLTIDLRVIVDIIAGASAGGINSVMLARALSHDLPVGRLRDLWLENADVTELLAPEAKAGIWSKWILRPLFWAAAVTQLRLVSDPEVRAKLSMFMRSRWFEPPFDGLKMAGLMYDAVTALGEPREPGASLLPSGQALDLFVTVTDFHGCPLNLQIHDPPIVHEREHRHVLHFMYRRHASGAVESDFDYANAPALAFAARATSSLPGAFPPARILEIDQLVKQRSIIWPNRAKFIASNFGQYSQANVDAASIPFIDGSVLDSHPFREAIDAIRRRAAYRQVDRRLVYVDPNPTGPGIATHHGMPGFFPTLKGALSDIPLAQPITDELVRIDRYNEQTRRLRDIIDGARPRVSRFVVEIMNDDGREPINEARIRDWRERANMNAARDAGFAYEAYVRLKLASARDFVSRLIGDLRGVRPNSSFSRTIAAVIDAWAVAAGATYEPADFRSLHTEAAPSSSSIPAWISFLLAFDVDYRKRRLRFLIEGQNRLSQMLGSEGLEGLDAGSVDRLKRRFYECYEALERRERAAFSNPETRDLVESIFRTGPSSAQIKEIGEYSRSFVLRRRKEIDELIRRLGSDVDLRATTSDIDILLADIKGWPSRARNAVFINYLGFSFWDVMTFPVIPWREPREFNEVRIDRISAQDARGINKLGSFPLQGAALNQSAALLSRAYRENDYLLGRLHAMDRLIDIVADAAGGVFQAHGTTMAIKRRGFLQILEAEEPHLPTCRKLIADIRAAITGM